MDFTIPEDGNYTIVVSDVSGAQPSPLNVYRLIVQRRNLISNSWFRNI
ncbi:MAG: hypothetical protein U0992_08375 [Planctomycetaceae bacterium]